MELQAAQAAARQLGLLLQPIDLPGAEQVDGAFDRMGRAQADALLVFNDTITIAARQRIVQLAAMQRLAAMYEAREWATAGGLVAWWPMA